MVKDYQTSLHTPSKKFGKRCESNAENKSIVQVALFWQGRCYICNSTYYQWWDCLDKAQIECLNLALLWQARNMKW